MNSDQYFRFHYENDFFTSTDYYYSQGINVEIGLPGLKKNPLNVLLPKLKYSNKTHGLAMEHSVFTPLSIRKLDISYKDRPFAAYFILKSFLITTDTLHQQRLGSTISIGILGPSAFGGGMQRNIHKWLDNIEPLGWEHQINNEAIVNYELSFEKQLYRLKDNFLLNSIVVIQTGTLMSNVQAGGTIMIGKFNSPFSSFDQEQERKHQVYFYAQPFLKLVGHNVTLNGGWFNRTSPYTITSRDIERIVFLSNFGIVFRFHKTYFEYSQSVLSKEFGNGKSHRYGGIMIGVRF
jgi:lipid A 3-O-deacylase